jgi:glutathione S-transferase
MHKGLPFEARPTSFSEIAAIGDGTFKTLPVVRVADLWVGGSSNIADLLEAHCGSGLTLFPDDPSRHFVRFIESWTDTTLHPQIFPLVAYGIWEQLGDSEKSYFRTTRERRLGCTLEAAREQALMRISEIRATLNPLRRTLKERPFLAGDTPAYADYIVFGALKWHSLSSDTPLYDESDQIAKWFTLINEDASPPD